MAGNGDAQPFVHLLGNSDIYLSHNAANKIQLLEAGTPYLNFYEDGTDDIVEGMTANNDLYLKPNGTGVLKFGTHAAITTETNSGFITIKDAAGNSRKLCVVS